MPATVQYCPAPRFGGPQSGYHVAPSVGSFNTGMTIPKGSLEHAPVAHTMGGMTPTQNWTLPTRSYAQPEVAPVSGLVTLPPPAVAPSRVTAVGGQIVDRAPDNPPPARALWQFLHPGTPAAADPARAPGGPMGFRFRGLHVASVAHGIRAGADGVLAPKL